MDISVADLLMARRRLQLTQKEAAKILGIHLGSLVDLEREVFLLAPSDMRRLSDRYTAHAESLTKEREMVAA